MSIKLWDWDKKWQCIQTFEGHTHYVMQVVFNPKDNNTFASASLDRTIKVRGCSFKWLAQNVFVIELRLMVVDGLFKQQIFLQRSSKEYMRLNLLITKFFSLLYSTQNMKRITTHFISGLATRIVATKLHIGGSRKRSQYCGLLLWGREAVSDKWGR